MTFTSCQELLGKEVFNEEVKGAVAEVRLDIYFNVTSFFTTPHGPLDTSISLSHCLHQGYFFLADIFKENEAKMIADRKAAEVYNLKSSIKVTFN